MLQEEWVACALPLPHARIGSARSIQVGVGGKCSAKPFGGAASQSKLYCWFEDFEASCCLVIRLSSRISSLSGCSLSYGFLSIISACSFIHPFTGSPSG